MSSKRDNNSVILYEAEVMSVDDNLSGKRIKAKISSDMCGVENIPWAFPLMPKVFSVMPKVGEMVLIITSSMDVGSNRFYIGPIISQPQNFGSDLYQNGIGRTDKLFSDRDGSNAQESIKNYEVATGAFPMDDAVSIIGRETEDISLKDGRVLIRAGARMDVSDEYEALQGKCGFDKKDTAFISLLKDGNGLDVHGDRDKDVAKSVAIIGADKLFFTSRHNADADAAVTEYNPETIIPDDKLQELQNALHAVPYGDILVECLNNLKNAMIQHVHPWAGLPPCTANGVEKVIEDDYNKILSNNMYVS